MGYNIIYIDNYISVVLPFEVIMDSNGANDCL